MPINIRSDETKPEFIARCIKQEINSGKPRMQAVAICYSKWENRKEDTDEDETVDS